MIGGQIGWDEQGRFPQGFVAQAAQALRNVLAVLREAGGGPEHIARLTWYVVDIEEYRQALPALGAAYRDTLGRWYPAMTLVQVAALVEREARVEIEATAIVGPAWIGASCGAGTMRHSSRAARALAHGPSPDSKRASVCWPLCTPSGRRDYSPPT